METDGILDALERKRALLNLSVTAMAARICIDRVHYHRLLRGYPPGKKTLCGILAEFPDLLPEVTWELWRVVAAKGGNDG